MRETICVSLVSPALVNARYHLFYYFEQPESLHEGYQVDQWVRFHMGAAELVTENVIVPLTIYS